MASCGIRRIPRAVAATAGFSSFSMFVLLVSPVVFGDREERHPRDRWRRDEDGDEMLVM
jgi:hypothetical protein